MAVVSHPPYHRFPRFKIKLDDRQFDTTEVIETESQAMLNTHTEHDFQDAFKKCQKRWERCISTEGTTSRVAVALGPKLVLTRWQHQSRKFSMDVYKCVYVGLSRVSAVGMATGPGPWCGWKD
jgi:hypothetical protein